MRSDGFDYYKNILLCASEQFSVRLWQEWSPEICALRERAGLRRDEVCALCGINENELLEVENGGRDAKIMVYLKLYVYYTSNLPA